MIHQTLTGLATVSGAPSPATLQSTPSQAVSSTGMSNSPKTMFRVGTEYLGEKSWAQSFKSLAVSIHRGSLPVLLENSFVASHSVTAMAGLIVGGVLFRSIPLLEAIKPLFFLSLSSWGLSFYGALRAQDLAKTDLFGLHLTVGGHGYEVRDVEGNLIRKIGPTDKVLQVDVRQNSAGKKLKGIPREEQGQAYQDILERGIPEILPVIYEKMQETGVSVVRLVTYLPSKFLKGLEEFEIKEVRLHEGDSGSFWHRLKAKLLKRAADFRIGQVAEKMVVQWRHPLRILLGLFIPEGFLQPKKAWTQIKKNWTRPWRLLNLLRPPFFKTYPRRTYLVFKEDIEARLRKLPST